MITNISLLKSKMKKRGITQEILATGVKIDRATLNRKLRQEGLKFTIHEANTIADYLGLSIEDTMKIFFAEKTASNERSGKDVKVIDNISRNEQRLAKAKRGAELKEIENEIILLIVSKSITYEECSKILKNISWRFSNKINNLLNGVSIQEVENASDKPASIY
jgi:hypothetical protein